MGTLTPGQPPGHPDTRTPGQGGHPVADTPTGEFARTPTRRPDTTRRTGSGEPKLAAVASWAVLFASFGLSAATWVALAVLAGFTGHITLTGWLGTVTLQLAWLMPIAIDGYVVVALVLWTAPVPAEVAAFARKNTYAAASVGVAAQSAFHALMAWSATGVLWRAMISAVVGALPPAVAALAVHMRALVRRKSGQVPADAALKRTAATRTARVPAVASTPSRVPVEAASTGQVSAVADSPGTAMVGPAADTSNVTPIAGRTRRAGASADTTIEDLADTLGKAFPDRTVGLPTALTELKRVHRSCSKERAIAAKNLHNERVAVQADSPPDSDQPASDDPDRHPDLATAGAL